MWTQLASLAMLNETFSLIFKLREAFVVTSGVQYPLGPSDDYISVIVFVFNHLNFQKTNANANGMGFHEFFSSPMDFVEMNTM